MKICLVTLVLLVLFPIASIAQARYMTKQGYIACSLKSDYDKLKSYLVQDDKDAAKILIRNGRCFVMKSGVEVVPMDSNWSGSVNIRLVGTEITVWTPREAIRRVK